MTISPRIPENSVTIDMIRKVHLTLADLTTGEEILRFLKNTEPIFMEEVNRFIKTEMSRMKYQITEVQALYIGSVIGASYIAGFLIAREAAHNLFDGSFTFKSDINEIIPQEEMDKIMDQKIDEGKSYKEIGSAIRNMLEKQNKQLYAKDKKLKDKRNLGKHLKLGDLD